MAVRPVISGLLLGVLCLPFGAVGCGDGSDPGLGVQVDFDPGTPRSARDEAVRVEVYLMSSCEGVSTGERPGSSIAQTHVLREVGGPPLGDGFDAGDYGVQAVALDADCAVVASGCEPVTLGPGGVGSVTVTLSAFAGAGCSLDEQCVVETGRCISIDDTCPGADDETSCTIADVDGVCRQGECCTGCWDGGACQPGDRNQACGTGGDICEQVPSCPF